MKFMKLMKTSINFIKTSIFSVIINFHFDKFDNSNIN